MVFKRKGGFKRKGRYKFYYHEFIKLRENIQNNFKIFNKFKKKKWENFLFYEKKKLKWYKKFKIQDVGVSKVTKDTNFFSSYKKRYLNSFLEYKKFRMEYGGFRKKKIKKYFKKAKKQKDKNAIKMLSLYRTLETRLDIILFRSKFFKSIQQIRQLIRHKKIKVNGEIIENKNFLIKKGDLISLNLNNIHRNRIYNNIIHSSKWPLPPRYLIINYTTLQIIFLGMHGINLASNSRYYFNLRKILSLVF